MKRTLVLSLALAACTVSDDGSDAPVDSDVPAGPPALCVSEIMASNAAAHEVDGAFPDWIELHNPGDADVALDGWWISDDADAPDKHVLGPDLSVSAGGWLVLLADDGLGGGPDSLPYKLAKEGEEVVLTDPDGRRDQLTFGVQATDYALSRVPDCCPDPECQRAVYGGTPGAENVEP